MIRAFSRDFHPPAPVISAVALARGSDRSVSFDGLLDTGAEVCALPARLFEILEVAPVGSARLVGSAGSREARVFRIDLDVAGIVLRGVKAIETARPHALLGRNVTRGLVLLLDGPRERLRIGPARAR